MRIPISVYKREASRAHAHKRKRDVSAVGTVDGRGYDGLLYTICDACRPWHSDSKHILKLLANSYIAIYRATAMKSFMLHFRTANSNSTARFVGPSAFLHKLA